MQVPLDLKTDSFGEKLLFQNVTGQLYKDIVLLNSNGIFICQYSNKLNNYNVINYSPLFSKLKGWNSEFRSTIKFEDVNLDGREEMIFTGPKGLGLLTFNITSNQWQSLLQSSLLSVPELHGKVLKVLPANLSRTNLLVFTQFKKSLLWGSIIQVKESKEKLIEPEPHRNVLPETSKLSEIPQITKLSFSESKKPIRFLRDDIDCSPFTDAVEKSTGRLKFQLSLVDLTSFSSDLGLKLFYDGSSHISDIFGVGWSIPLTFIRMYHQTSVFPEDEQYHIFLNDQPQQIKLDPKTSNETVSYFKVNSNQTNLLIAYYKSEERWEVDSEGIKQIYGRLHSSEPDPIIWELTWQNWRGPGSSRTGQKRLATAWYLAEVRDQRGGMIHYTYEIVNKRSFTRELYLTSIYDDQGNAVNFKYSDKEPSEFKIPPLTNEEGIFNTQQVQTRFCEGYTLTTPIYRQEVDFAYDIISGKRSLVKIQQKDDPTHQPVIQFAYEEISKMHVMKEIFLPSGAKVALVYQSLGEVSLVSEQLGHRYDVPKEHRVDYGVEDVLISYLNEHRQICVRMFSKDFTKELLSSTSDSALSRFPLLGTGPIKSYDIVRGEDYLAILLFYSKSNIELCLMHNEDRKWPSFPDCYRFSEDSIIRFGRDFVVTADKNTSVEVISWNKDCKCWKKNINSSVIAIKYSTSLLIEAFNRMFLVYDDDVLQIMYQDYKDEWQSKTIKRIPGVVKSIKDTLDMFDLEDSGSKMLFNFFKMNALQFNSNQIVLNRWTSEGNQLYSVIDLFILDRYYNIAHESQKKLAQDNLDSWSYEIEAENKNFLTVAYKYRDHRYRVIVKNIRGPIVDSIKEVFARVLENEISTISSCHWPVGKTCGGEKLAAKSKVEKQIEDKKQEVGDSFLKSLGKIFLLNPGQYKAVLGSQSLLCNNTKIVFTGDKWIESTIKETSNQQGNISIPLGDKLLLVKENNASSVKIFNQGINKNKQGGILLDLGIKLLNETLIQNFYPSYLVHQGRVDKVHVVEFSNEGGIGKSYVLPPRENLSSWSNYDTLITYIDNIDEEQSKTLVFRQQLGMRRLLPNPVISKSIVTFDNNNNKRITGYMYDVSSAHFLGGQVYYERVSSIPGNEKSTFGWVEETLHLENQTKTDIKIFNAKGELVKILKRKQEQSNSTITEVDDEIQKDNSSIYFDKTEKLEVARCFHISIDDEEMGYYGFENYEVNRIGKNTRGLKKKSWIFTQSDVIGHDFSLTGRNLLRLSEKSIQGTFQPINQNQSYVASSWVRPHNTTFCLGDVTTFLKAVISTDSGDEILGILGETKLKFGEWFYVEVAIDLIFAKEFYKNENLSLNSTYTSPQELNFNINITLSSVNKFTYDVDHVRFSPLNSNFKATVYDLTLNKISETISANGLIRKQIYDHHGEEIASLDEFGILESLNTYTKSTSTGRVVKLQSTVLIQPQRGFYEDFSPYSFRGRWRIDNSSVWSVSQNHLRHSADDYHRLEINPYEINRISYGLRLFYSLDSATSCLKFHEDLKLLRAGKVASFVLFGNELPIPLSGEVLLVVEKSRLFVWIDGGLYYDSLSNKSLFSLQIRGSVTIRDFILFSDPEVKVTYFNDLQEKVQEVLLEEENTAIVTEYLYDELGRLTITTQPTRITKLVSEALLCHHSSFVLNSHPHSNNSVWKTHRLQGDIVNVVGEFAFSQVEYADNPTNEKSALGLPGTEFAVYSKYAKRFSTTTKNLFINNLFPVHKNFSHQIMHGYKNIEEISVFDDKKNKVAWYLHIPGRKSLLSTYEYNDDRKLVKKLPPLYHEKAHTFLKLQSQHQTSSDEEKFLQEKLGDHIGYDANGNIISRDSPDSGRVEYLYDKKGLLKFTLYYSNLNKKVVENVIYFDYDGIGRLKSTGKLRNPPLKDKLMSTETVLDKEEYQQFYHSDSEREPILRGNLKRSITFISGEPLIEESILGLNKETLSKRILIPVEGSQAPLLIAINKKMKAGKVTEIEYPINFQGLPFKLIYSYNKLGHIKDISMKGKLNSVLRFKYSSAGFITSEDHMPENEEGFTRQFSYNTAGFLTNLDDKFLTEKVYYTTGSYGGYGYGDGTIMRTEFIATWNNSADDSGLGLGEHSFASENLTLEESTLCFNKLKEKGYISDENRQSKIFYPSLEMDFPIVCSYGKTGRKIQKVLGKHGFPFKYGHSYDYGNHQELTKAKYFVGEEFPLPLQPGSFSKHILGVSVTDSLEIWRILKTSGYLITDDSNIDGSFSHAKQGKSIIRSKLHDDLRGVCISCAGYYEPLKRFLACAFSKKIQLDMLKSSLQKAFVSWNNGLETNALQQTSSKIIKMLVEKKYLESPLNEGFHKSLRKYEKYINDIVRVLLLYFARQLGEAEYDLESFEIDANGNHRKFYTGFDRLELNYQNNTNQVTSIKFNSFSSYDLEQEYNISYDSRGNVVQALHKGIKKIEYYPVSNRAKKVILVDGKAVEFYYDAEGERILKRVVNEKGKLLKEIHYLRDEFGRALVERQISYISEDLVPDIVVTAYIYGPRGLVGFIRGDEFYSTITDHEGSVHLVVKGNGEVVAAYNYLPYGDLMHEYGVDPEAHLSYRYAGQEWDEELNLYNYHARFYDPKIGRFYQIDPKGQYFSPYKYAGNSPVSTVDPDGQFAFLAILLPVVFGAVRAYLGGAAANNNFKFWEWKLNAGTFLGILAGGVAGALIPVSFGASVEFLTLSGLSYTAASGTVFTVGVGMAYLGGAASNQEWDFTKWNYKSPRTYFGAFEGFSMGVGVIGGVRNAQMFYKSLSSLGKVGFVAVSSTVGGGLFVLNGKSANWDLSKPGFYYGSLNALFSAPDLPIFIKGASNFLFKNARVMGKSFRSFGAMYGQNYAGKTVFSKLAQAVQRRETRETLKQLLGQQVWRETGSFLLDLYSHEFFQSLGQTVGGLAISGGSAFGMGYLVSENGLDFGSVSTYQAMVNGLLTGGQLASVGRAYFRSKKPKLELEMMNEQERIAQEYAKRGLLMSKEAYERGGTIDGMITESAGQHTKTVQLKGHDFEIRDPDNLVNVGKPLSIETETGKDWVLEVTQRGKIKRVKIAQEDSNGVISIEDSFKPLNEDTRVLVIGDQLKTINLDGQNFNVRDPDNVIDVAKSRRVETDEGVLYVMDVEDGVSPPVKFAYKDGNGLISIDPKFSELLNKFHPVRTGQTNIPYQDIDMIRRKDIPNTAVSVAVTEHLAVVTLSRTKAPGLVLFIDRVNDVSYPIYLTQNKILKELTVNVAQEIEETIAALKLGRRQEISEQFNSKVVNELTDALSKEIIKIIDKKFPEIPQDICDFIKQKFTDEILDITKTSLNDSILTKIIGEATKSKLHVLNEEKSTLKKRKIELEKQKRVVGKLGENEAFELNKLVDDLTNLELKIKTMSNVDKVKLDLTKRVWEKPKIGIEMQLLEAQMKDQFPTWLPSNCAEPSAIFALQHSQALFRQSPYSMEFKIQDISYLATYMVPRPFPNMDTSNFLSQPEIPDLQPFERCNYCKVTTGAVKNIITDKIWIDKLNKIKAQSIKLKKPKENLYFLLPFNSITNSLFNITQQQKESSKPTLSRKKRSYDQLARISQSLTFLCGLDFTFKKSSVSGLHEYGTKKLLSDTVTKTGSSIVNLCNWIKISLSEQLKFHPLSTGVEEYKYQQPSISEVNLQSLDVDGTILLLDLFVRKLTGQKYISRKHQQVGLSFEESQICALNITNAFEQILKDSAGRSGIHFGNVDFDPVRVQTTILKQIRKGDFHKIPDILYLFAQKACKDISSDCLANIKTFLQKVLQEDFQLLSESEFIFHPNTNYVELPPEMPNKFATQVNGTFKTVKGLVSFI